MSEVRPDSSFCRATRSTCQIEVLLVEDNPRDVALAQRAMGKSKIPYRVVVVRDGLEALDYLLATGRSSDRPPGSQLRLVILDLKLPKLDGFEVLRRLRREPRTRFIPVVILTSSGESDDIATGYAAGANSYIRKPVDYLSFEGIVRQLETYWLLVNETPASVGS